MIEIAAVRPLSLWERGQGALDRGDRRVRRSPRSTAAARRASA